MAEQRAIRIPARGEHNGIHALTITVDWVCLDCGGPRGEPFETLSFDGSRRLGVHGWKNACGHVEPYGQVRRAYYAAADAVAAVEALLSGQATP